MSNKVKMKRHESFSIREGWLVKGINAVKSDPKIFSSSDATDILGIGTNMVKSLKYWLIASGVVHEDKKGLFLTDLGNLIDKYDPYFDDLFSWWMIHTSMLFNYEEFYILYLFFNKCNMNEFSKEDVLQVISNILTNKSTEFNEKILLDEINMIIKSYSIDEKIDNPENNFICPLSELELIKKIGKDLYEKNRPSYRKLNYLVVYYIIKNVISNEKSISIEDLMTIENGPAKILNLDKNLLNEYLDEIRNSGLIDINRTAGLNMLYLRKDMSLSDIFVEYFEGGIL